MARSNHFFTNRFRGIKSYLELTFLQNALIDSIWNQVRGNNETLLVAGPTPAKLKMRELDWNG